MVEVVGSLIESGRDSPLRHHKCQVLLSNFIQIKLSLKPHDLLSRIFTVSHMTYVINPHPHFFSFSLSECSKLDQQ